MAEKAGERREDPRVTRTRNLIRDALVMLLGQKPFHDISVQDIAEQATINRATFYAHFEDKYDLLEYLVRDGYQSALGRRDPLSASNISSLLETISLSTFSYVDAHKKCKIDKEFEPQFERALQAGLYEFLLPALGDAAALVVSSAVIGAAMQWRASRRKEPVEEMVQRLVSVLSAGVRLPESALSA
jgi:AcrR family transcriptional regulator